VRDFPFPHDAIVKGDGLSLSIAAASIIAKVTRDRIMRELDREFPFPHDAIVKGDGLSLSIAAASIIAKVTRDRLMREIDREHPQYGFAKHQGYGTKAHLEALRNHGPCCHHRRSFQPVAQLSLPLDGT
jgi:ribonuclease HII